MAMSWVAEANAMARARAPITQTASGRLDTPASHKVTAKSATWPMRIQPRLRPRKGGGKRSIQGDHSSLKDQGAWARVKRPMIRMSTPSRAIHAGMASHTTPSGGRGERQEDDERSPAARHPAQATAVALVLHLLRHAASLAAGEDNRSPADADADQAGRRTF
jgi:HAMP domain-containing protein